MKTKTYNPSQLEIELANIFKNLKSELSNGFEMNTVEDITIDLNKDNPDALVKLVDTDGDKHEIVVKFIQRADAF